MHIALLISTLSFLLGVLLASSVSSSTEIAISLLVIVGVQSVIFLLRRSMVAKYTLLISSFLLFGILRFQFVNELPAYVCETQCEVTGRIVDAPDVKDAYQIFDIAITESEALLVRVRAPLYPTYEAGDIVTMSGKIILPEIIYPHGSGKTFDYPLYLKNKKVGSEMYYPKVIEVTKSNNTFLSSLTSLRESFVTRIGNNMKGDEASLTAGMLLGNQNMSSEMLTTFRIAGLSHIVVLSGFNIAIVAAAILFLLSLLPLFLRAIVAALAVLLFVFMVGATPSVVRATLMTLVALSALLLGRQYIAKQALLLSLFVVSVYDPIVSLTDVSLHLSFLATAGILYLVPIIEKVLTRLPKGVMKELLVTTLAAYIATLPYIMHVFGTVSLYAVIANLIVLPFVPIIMLLGFATLLSSYISSILALIIGYITTLPALIVIAIAKMIEGLPYAYISLTLGTFGMYLMYAFILLGGVYISFHRKNETLVTKNNEILSPVMSY